MIFPATSTSIYGWDFPWRTVSHNQRLHQYPEDQQADRIINQPTGIRFGTLPEHGPLKWDGFSGGQTF